jgi:hypothetical protein
MRAILCYHEISSAHLLDTLYCRILGVGNSQQEMAQDCHGNDRCSADCQCHLGNQAEPNVLFVICDDLIMPSPEWDANLALFDK